MSPSKASTCKHSHVAFAHLWFNDITLHYFDFLNADLGHNVIFLELTATNIGHEQMLSGTSYKGTLLYKMKSY